MGNHNDAIAYTDGSYNPVTKKAGYAYNLIFDSDLRLCCTNSISDDEIGMRNVTGELLAVMRCCYNALYKYNLSSIQLNYDYIGVENWVTGKWQARNKYTQKYRDFMLKIIDDGLNIEFVKVKAHSGIAGNEIVDRLAKEACGISVAKVSHT